MSKRKPLLPGTTNFTGRHVDTMTRFSSKVVRSETGCWDFVSAKDRDGYSVFLSDRFQRAHQFSFEAFRYQIPTGLTVDHLCRRRACVNPFHMELVPNGVNVLRGNGPCAKNARKTHCKHGHPFSGDNLRVRLGRRVCLACEKDKREKYRLKKLAERL